ncbi:MAG: VOC family protein [Armatimonadetes bacterium]|nr:VOC family protein [Armatimonadota bacterium]MDE2207570.1 VOC family protein [Armatimonadota bacterium]
MDNTNLAQVAILVRDIEEARHRFATLLGQEPAKVIVTQPGDEVAMTYRGVPSNAQCKLALFSVGPVQLELIEPMGGSSTWQEGLDQQGESVHHIAFWTEDMQKSADSLKAQGVPMVQRGDMGDGQYAYFDGRERLGVVIELLERTRKARATP